MAECKNLAEGKKGRGKNMQAENWGDGYSCECKIGSTFDDTKKECSCLGFGYFWAYKI